MSSNITVSSLTATSVAGGVKLAWAVTDPNANGLPYRSLDAVEVWAATSNDRSGATKVGEGITDFFHNYLPVETFFYYWIKARDKEGSEGDWYPSGSTSGVVGGTIGLAGLSFSLMGGKIVAEVDSSGDLTVSIETAAGVTPSSDNPVFVAYANTVSGPPVEGGYTIRSITSSLSLTIGGSDVENLGSDTDPFNIYVCAFDNGGTPVLALINCNNAADGHITPLSHMAPSDTQTLVKKGAFIAGSSITGKYYRIIGRIVWNDGTGSSSSWSEPDRIDLHSMDSKLPGDVVQEFSVSMESQFSTVDRLIPLDNTIPQWSEGYAIGGASEITITPTCAGNVIECEASVPMAFSTSGYLMLALFRDSDTDGTPESDALAASLASIAASTDIVTLSLQFRQLAGQTDPIEYLYRIGSDVNGTIYICRLAASAVFNLKHFRRFAVREIMA